MCVKYQIQHLVLKCLLTPIRSRALHWRLGSQQGTNTQSSPFTQARGVYISWGRQTLSNNHTKKPVITNCAKCRGPKGGAGLCEGPENPAWFPGDCWSWRRAGRGSRAWASAGHSDRNTGVLAGALAWARWDPAHSGHTDWLCVEVRGASRNPVSFQVRLLIPEVRWHLFLLLGWDRKATI